jgi:protoporphyrinogen oxidase
MSDRADIVVLGGGLAGLAAAHELGDRAIVIEKESRPGGLARTEHIDGYWFDHVLHLLHFQDDAVERRIRALPGHELAPVTPEAWVETAHGVARFPVQLHLSGLDPETIDKCLTSFEQATHDHDPTPPRDYQDLLLRSFGRELCDLFFFPYNRKQWKRPLDTLAPSGFQWNIARPALDVVVRGARDSSATTRAYNANGWYPRPASNDLRGMEVVSRALAAQVADLRLKHRVVSIHPDERYVVVANGGGEHRVHYDDACIATLPLPTLIAMTAGVPASLRDACARLLRNRVLTVMIRVLGPRPVGRGFWRYYADESVCFTRLIYMHEFDPRSAPDDGWGMMAEIVEPSEWPVRDGAAVISDVRRDIEKVGALPTGCELLGAHVRAIDPAYVVFTLDSRPVVERAHEFLRSRGVFPLGRYGRWEYSSMAQVMRDGFTLAEESAARKRKPSDAA